MDGDDTDVVVVGGGVVGIAIARQFLLQGRRVTLLERRADVLLGASGTNSSLLHCGFDCDASRSPLEAQLVRRGHGLWERLLARVEGRVLLRTGAAVAAWTAHEAEALPALLQRAHLNGCPEAELLSGAAAQARYGLPHLVAALHVPREYVADSWLGGVLLLHQALELGLRLRLGTPASRTLLGRARLVVNAAGVDADVVETLRTDGHVVPFVSMPRLGQFVVLDDASSSSPPVIVYPVPSTRTKGVVLWRSLSGALVVGPTAEDTTQREPQVRAHVTEQLVRTAAQRLPLRSGARVMLLAYAGVRPATDRADYVVDARAGWVTVAGIRSTGFTAALALAQHVVGPGAVGEEDPRWFHIPPALQRLALNSDGRTVTVGAWTHTPHPQTVLRLARAKL